MLRPYSTVARVFVFDIVGAQLSAERRQPRIDRVRDVRGDDDAGRHPKRQPVELRRRCLDAMPKRFAQRRCASHGIDAVGMRRNAGQRLRIERDPQAPRRVGALREERAARMSARDTDRRAAGPWVASRNAALSRTRARDDVADRHAAPALADIRARAALRARVGFRPTRPQHDAGMRIEPPPSVACAAGMTPAATAAPAPPLDPPEVFSQIPRIAAHAEQHRLGRDVQPEFRRVGATEQQQSCRPVTRDESRNRGPAQNRRTAGCRTNIADPSGT